MSKMRNTILLVLLFLACNIPNTNLHAQTQIKSCNTQFIDNGGVNSNYLNNENAEWLICPDDSSQYLTLTFTHIDIEVANNNGKNNTGCYDLLYIYDGIDDSAPLIGAYCGEGSGTGKKSFIDGHTLDVGDSFRPKNQNGCFFIRFVSDQSKNLSGWYADVTCCSPSLDDGLTDGIDTPMPNNNGNVFDLVIDNSCTRYGSLGLFTEFEPSGKSCFTKGLTFDNQAFYAFTSNSSGGFVEFAVDAIDSVGIMEMIVFGPVNLDSSGKYTGGAINDCVKGEDPRSLFFNAGPNQTYILGVSSELAGRSNVATLPFTVGLSSVLPVKLIDYRLIADEDLVEITWTTSQEINNDEYEIYRSFDGKAFNAIGTQRGATNTNLETTYHFYDYPNVKGDVYYYVKQIDLDGRYTDFAILKASFAQAAEKMTSYPNPSYGGNFSLIIDEEILESDAQLQLFDQVGKQVVNRKLNGQTVFDFQNLTQGLYIIKIQAGSKVISHKHLVY